MGYLAQDGTYYEGDNQGSDIEVPNRPSANYSWVDGEWVVTKETLWDLIRSFREPLLDRADIEINKAFDKDKDLTKLKAYRQALRDITKQADPNNIVWPDKPWA